ncbi:MAG: polysaccharide deacetylase family protein [Steroidobacteraceae bacterium]
MGCVAVKVDVDTYHGTLEGVPRLLDLLEASGAGATFLFSLGRDHTGRAIRRVFRPGFLGKVRRTSVAQHYGLRTLLYGTLLPGPHIGRRCAAILREVAARGFEVGVHVHDHVRWQDYVAGASEAWTRRELQRALDVFAEVFGRAATVHGAAGWQMNRFVPGLEQEFGIKLASDARGTGPFLPVVDGKVIDVPQLPTTLPTLDELVGRDDLRGQNATEYLLAETRAAGEAAQVYTAHAELEGGAFAEDFGRLIGQWRAAGRRVCGLTDYAQTLDRNTLPRCPIVTGTVAGRSGMLAVQGSAATP